MYKWLAMLTLAFFIFILWTIYLANTASGGFIHAYIRSLPYGDKMGHLVLFGSLAFLAIISLRYRAFSLAGIKIYYGAALVSVFVILEEFSQVFIPTRNFDKFDLLADFIGIILAILAAKLCSYFARP